MARAGVVRRAQAHSRKTPRLGVRERESEGRQNHPAAGYSHPLDEATDCDGVLPSSTSSSSSSSCSLPSSFPLYLPPSLRCNPYLLCRLLRVYRTALANLKLSGVIRGVSRNGMCCHRHCRGEPWNSRISGILFQREHRPRDIPRIPAISSSGEELAILYSYII